MAEGKGKFYHSNGDIYEGNFYQNRSNGYGEYIHSNG